MFGTHFYHQRIRKSVAVFGAMFNNLYVLRSDSTNKVISQVKVPLAYAPQAKYLARIRENPDLVNDTKVALKLPRMSFEIIGYDYDNTRQLQKLNSINKASTTVTTRNKFYAPVPYNINFQLNIYAKTQDDALQIVEQIIPYFNPQYTLTVKPFSDYPTIKEDTPIILNNITFQDDYENVLEARRTIIYTLDFIMKVNFHGPIDEGKIIRQIDANLGEMEGGLNDSDIAIERIRIIPDPANAEPEDDYGFTLEYTQLIDSA